MRRRAALRFAAELLLNDKPTGAVVGSNRSAERALELNDKAGSVLNLLRWVSPARSRNLHADGIAITWADGRATGVSLMLVTASSPGFSHASGSAGDRAPGGHSRSFGEEGARLTYGSYLRLEELLDQQRLLSDPPAHDELLFITIHQVYELWFKQLLHEVESARDAMFAGKLWWAPSAHRVGRDPTRADRQISVLGR
jgi:hypothetical protein